MTRLIRWLLLLSSVSIVSVTALSGVGVEYNEVLKLSSFLSSFSTQSQNLEFMEGYQAALSRLSAV
jgi:hypothetical protein